MPDRSHDRPAGHSRRATRRLPRTCRATAYARSSSSCWRRRARWPPCGRPAGSERGGSSAPRSRRAGTRHGVLAAALAPRALAGLSPDTPLGLSSLPSPREARPSRHGWTACRSRRGRRHVDPQRAPRRPAPRGPPRRRTRTGRRVRHTAEHAGADLGVGAGSRGAVRGAAISRRASSERAPTPAARDRRRRRRAGCSPGTGGRRDPEGVEGRASRRTRPKSNWCVTLAPGHRRPGSRTRGSSAHPTG